jgi:hypothetical protein
MRALSSVLCERTQDGVVQRGFRYLRGRDDWLDDLIGKPVNLGNDLKRSSFETPTAFFRVYAEEVYEVEQQDWHASLTKNGPSHCLCCGTKPQQQSPECEECQRPHHKKCAPFLSFHKKQCCRPMCEHKEDSAPRCHFCFRLSCTNCLPEHLVQCFAFCVERDAVPKERAQVCFVCHADRAKDKHVPRVQCAKKGCTPKRWRHKHCSETPMWKQHEQDCGTFLCVCKVKHEDKNPLSKHCNFCDRKICVFSDFDAHEATCWELQADDEEAPKVQRLDSIAEESDDTDITTGMVTLHLQSDD